MKVSEMLLKLLVFVKLLLLKNVWCTSWDTNLKWSYENTSNWGETCKNGNKQSPIDIDLATLEVRCQDEDLMFDIATRPRGLLVENNGKTVSFHIPSRYEMKLKRGGLPYTYTLRSFHFHWQSEHTVAGLQYPLEIHLVHVKQDLDMKSALKSTDADTVTVVSVFVKIVNESDFQRTNSPLKGIESIIPYIGMVQNGSINHKHCHECGKNGKSIVQMPAFYPYSLLPTNTSTLYEYKGSLTTPPCDQVVLWLAMTHPVFITQDQLKVFYNLYNAKNELMMRNNRQIQSKNGRKVILKIPKCERQTARKLIPDIVYSVLLFSWFCFGML